MGKNRQKKNPWKRTHRVLTLFLALALVLTAIPIQRAMVVRAEGEEPNPMCDRVICWNDDHTEIVGVDDATTVDRTTGKVTFNSLSIRERDHYIQIIGVDVQVDTLTLAEGTRIEVVNEESETGSTGKLSWDTITASNGARMFLQNSGNIPTGMSIYIRGGQEGTFTQLPPEELVWINWTEVEFVVLQDVANDPGRWVWNSYEYDCFGPTQEKEILVELQVNDYPNDIWEPEQFPLTFPNTISEDDQAYDGNRAKIRVPIDTSSVTISWAVGDAPRNIGVLVGDPDTENGWRMTNDPQGISYELILDLQKDENTKEDYYWVEFNYGADPNNGGNDPDNGGNPNGGDSLDESFKRLDEEENAEFHAYGNQVLPSEQAGDATDTDNTDVEDLKLGWAKCLTRGFEQGGRYFQIGEHIGLGNDKDENVQKVVEMISSELQENQFILAYDSANTQKSLDAYTLTFSCPKDMNNIAGDKYTVTTTAYMIQKEDVSSGYTYAQVVIKVGNEFYIRSAGDFPDDAGNKASEFVSLGANDNKDNTRALNIVTEAYTKVDDVILFGNNASMNDEQMSDDSAEKYYVNNFWMNENGQEMGGKIAIYHPDFTGVFLKPDTESTKEAAAWEINTSYDIKESGVTTSGGAVQTDFYFGYSKATLSALTGDKLSGLKVTKLSNVKVVGGIPDNAVKVTDNTDGTFTVEFLSDYYDEVTLNLTYLLEDDSITVNNLTINRVGIVVQYGRTPGDNRTTVQIHHGHEPGDDIRDDGKEFAGVIYATYYHPQGSITADTSDTSLYVTFYYKDGRTEQKIVKADFFTAESDEKTAMSDYVLAIAPENTNVQDVLPVKVDVIAVENADNNGRFNGAKLGAGKGVECVVNFDD